MTLGYARKNRLSICQLAACYACLFIMILFFKNSEAAAVWVGRGLSLCVQKLIPSLFPFMVISTLVVSSDACTAFFSVLTKPLRFLLGISRDGACALALGWLCGFPIGAKCASRLYGDGKIGFAEYELLCCVCSIPSPAFLIISVGQNMLGSRILGATLYLVSLLCALLLGVFLSFGARKQAVPSSGAYISAKKVLRVDSVAEAISSSAVGMLSICGFVVFFSAFLGVLEQSMGFFSLSDTARALLFCAFEMTSGLSALSSLQSPHSLALCALAAGWSGLCVHFQTFAVCSGTGLRPRRFAAFQAVRALLCFAVCLVAELFV